MKFIDINNIQKYFDDQDMKYNIINVIGNINNVYGTMIHVYTGCLSYYYLFLDRQNKYNLKISDDIENIKVF
jgi:hypothetical protein